MMVEPDRPTTSPTMDTSASPQRGPDQTRRLLPAVTGAVVGLLAAFLAIVALVKTPDGDAGPERRASAGPSVVDTSPAQAPDTSAIIAMVTGVPASVLDQVGKGDVHALPKPLRDQPELKDADQPLALFVGSEACPHCATQRWAVAIAFSRFGTFSGLTTNPRGAQSPTGLSFHGATFSSQYLALHTVEIADSSGGRLQELTPEQETVMNNYGSGAVPFLDLGNRYVMVGTSYSANAMSGKTASQIAEALDDPSDPITQAIGGGANALTTAICAMTGNQPGEVCSTAAAQAYAGAF